MIYINFKRDACLFMAILSLVLALSIMQASATLKECMEISSSFKCESYFNLKSVFMDISPDVVFLFISSFFVSQAIIINRRERKINKAVKQSLQSYAAKE